MLLQSFELIAARQSRTFQYKFVNISHQFTFYISLPSFASALHDDSSILNLKRHQFLIYLSLSLSLCYFSLSLCDFLAIPENIPFLILYSAMFEVIAFKSMSYPDKLVFSENILASTYAMSVDDHDRRLLSLVDINPMKVN